MEYWQLGRTGLRVSEIGFGCGNVGGLIIRSDQGTRIQAVQRAMELGISSFTSTLRHRPAARAVGFGLQGLSVAGL